MKNKTSISIVIPTMNRVQSLLDTIEYLQQGTDCPDEIIVVDQSKSEEVQEQIQSALKETKISCHYFHRPPSLTAARNFGLRQASNDVVVFMDDDVRVQPETIEHIQSIMEEDSISMIAGLDLNAGTEKSKLGYVFGKKSYRKRAVGHVTGALYGRLPQKTTQRVQTQWAMGYFFAIRKSLAQKWQLAWDERFHSYGYPEDLDFSYRYWRASKEEGLQCIVDPLVSVYHMVSKEWRETEKAVTFMQVIHREYLTYKWGLHWTARLFTRWSNFGLFCERAVRRNRCLDVLKAQYYCDCYRKDIKKGILHPELYQ